jgi:hypothetical protein
MNLTVLNYGLAIVGSVGLLGFAALLIFAPAVASLLARGALNIIRDLLKTRVGVAILVGILCLIAGEIAGDWHGRSACRTEQARADAEAKARDQDQAELATYDAMQRSDALKSAAAKDKETVHALAKADAACHAITADQLR